MFNTRTVNPIADLVASIIGDHETQDLLSANGLRAHSVTWEDTARTNGSCWGPNISDMTLVVKDGNGLMPVIRKPNFSDVTQDVPIDTFKVCTGNQGAFAEKRVLPLREYLANLPLYTDNPNITDLTLPRDDVVLTSSQCCVLPVKKGSKTEFAVQLFNYQSYNEDPAVLVVLVTKDGVSTQILERSNQKLFFNDNGTARWFTAERLQDNRERKTGKKQEKVKSFTEMKEDEKMENVIMMIQIPLKQKPRPQTRGLGFGSVALGSSAGFNMANACAFGAVEECEEDCDDGMDLFSMSGGTAPVYRSMSLKKKRVKTKGVGMDMGMIGLGSSEGKYTGTKSLKLERDDRFPIRCTFQYYRVTDDNHITEHDINDIAAQIAKAEKVSVAKGSLVSNTETGRKTEPVLDQPKPSDNPFGKLEERTYLDQVATKSTEAWGSQSMSGFM